MPEQPTERREGGDEPAEGQVVEKRKRYVYPFRTDINLMDAAREDRLERLVEERGEPNVNTLVRRLIDEDAQRWGVYDPPGAVVLDEDEAASQVKPAQGMGLRERVDAYERRLIGEALAQCEGNRSEAARNLLVSRATLLEKIRKHGLGISRAGELRPPQQSAPEQPRGVRLGGTSGARLNRGGGSLAEPDPRRK